MAKQSAIDKLKPEDKDWLDSRFRDQGFCGYEEIAQILQERGYDISKSSVHRYGKNFEQRLENVQASTEAAMMMQKLAPDDGGHLSGAVLSMIQSGFFDCLVALQEVNETVSPEKRLALLSKVSVGISKIADSSVNQKKWMVEAREKVEAAAKAVEKIVKKGGMSKDTVDEVKKEILGIIGL